MTSNSSWIDSGRGDIWRRGARKIVIHYHLYKNAGTSIDEFLHSTFQCRWKSFDPAPTAVLTPAGVAAYLHDQPDILALSSHVLRPPAPEGFHVFPIALIRHPLDRACSVYNHVKHDTSGSDTAKAASSTDFPGFVRWCLDHPAKGGMVIINYQVIHFSSASLRGGHIFEAVATEGDLLEAVALIRTLPCSGVVDQFGEYFERLQLAMTTWIDRAVRGPTPWANATGAERMPLQQKIVEIERLVGPEMSERFREANILDYLFYRQVASRDTSQT